MSKERFQIEPSERENDGVWVWGIGTYGRGSVLEGRVKRRRVDHYDTAEEALEEHPKADVLEFASSHSSNRDDNDAFQRSPAPADFDPMDAGEEW
jgi:hypothetical protein